MYSLRREEEKARLKKCEGKKAGVRPNMRVGEPEERPDEGTAEM